MRSRVASFFSCDCGRMRAPSGILALFFSAILLTSSVAGPLEDGTEAFEKNDWVLAMILLQPLADRGNVRAQFMVGAMHFRGWGVAEDFGAGLTWIRKAADQGDAEAQSHLGDAYLEGRGTKLDYAEAMRWFLKAADQGDSSAQRSIAEMYAKGLGVAKSQAKAKEWYEKSRKQPQLPAEGGRQKGKAEGVTL